MKLYSGPLSLFTAKVRIALAEKDLDYDRVEVGWSLENRYEPHHPDVVALNPKRQVPVLVDDGVTVYDSTLIFEYLEDRYPEPPLFPKSTADRARCRQWEDAADEILFPHVWDLIEERFYPSSAGSENPERAAAAVAGATQYMKELDRELGGGAYLCGDFSVADIGNFIMVLAASSLGAAIPESCASLAGWNARVAARPAVRADVEGVLEFRASLGI